MLINKLLAQIKSIDSVELVSHEKLIMSLIKLSSSQIALSKMQTNLEDCIEIARDSLIKQLSEEIMHSPELLEKLILIAQSLKVE